MSIRVNYGLLWRTHWRGRWTAEAGRYDQWCSTMINGAVPYIWFWNHKERIMGKKRLERIIPLVDPLLGPLADYLNRADLNRNEPIFPTYGGAGTPPLIAQRS